MRDENCGPVANPDGSPTQVTLDMLAGTGRDPVEFAAAVPIHEPEWCRGDDGCGCWCYPCENRECKTLD
jgi:hypothetical protein